MRSRGKGRPESQRKSLFVIGVGNPFMKDDGVGITVARTLRKLDLGLKVSVLERQVADLSILTYARKASKVVIVDAVKSGKPPGSTVKFNVDDPRSPLLRVPFSHEAGLRDMVAFARRSGIRLPPITVVGVEPADCGPGEGLSKPVADALPLVIEEVVNEVKSRAIRRVSD